MTQADPVVKLQAALAEALPKLEGAKKNSANPHFKSKYADLGSVIEAIRPVAEHGIWFRQSTLPDDNGITIETFYIGHGASISAGVLHMPADKRNPQGFGSALTYARRYGLQTAFGLATEDDDGNAASQAEQPKKAKADTITEAQLEELQLLFTHLPIPVADFLKVAQIKTLDALPASWFDRAKAWVNDQAKAKRAADLDDEIANFDGEK